MPFDSLRDLVAQWRESARKWKRCPEGGHDDMAHATSQGVAIGKTTCADELEAAFAQQAQPVSVTQAVLHCRECSQVDCNGPSENEE